MKFDKNGDGLGRYNIYNFQRNVEGNFVYQKVTAFLQSLFTIYNSSSLPYYFLSSLSSSSSPV